MSRRSGHLRRGRTADRRGRDNGSGVPIAAVVRQRNVSFVVIMIIIVVACATAAATAAIRGNDRRGRSDRCRSAWYVYHGPSYVRFHGIQYNHIAATVRVTKMLTSMSPSSSSMATDILDRFPVIVFIPGVLR